MKQRYYFALALVYGLSGCDGHINYDQTSVYGSSIRNVLVSKGLCRDEMDCNRKEMMLAAGSVFKASPVHLSIYNIPDTATADAIVAAAKAVRADATVGLKLEITSSQHLDTPYKNVRRETIR